MTGIRPDQFYGLPGQGMSLPQWLVNPITDDELAMRYPGTSGDPVSAPDVRLPPAPRMPTPQDIEAALYPPKPQPSLDWRTRLFGGADPLGVLNQQQAAGAGRQALRDFGISLLQNSGPSPFRRGTGELLGTALQAGQQSFQQGVQSVARRLQQARENSLRDRQTAVAEQNANTQSAFAAQRQPVDPALQTIRGISGRALGLDPTKTYTVQRNRQGNLVGAPLEETPAAREGGGGGDRVKLSGAIIDDFARDTRNHNTAHEAWTQVDQVLQRAQSDQHSPDDIIQLIDGISRLNNPGAVVRVGTVNVQLQKIGSYAQKLQMWYDRANRGAWPTEIVEGIAKAAREIAREQQKQYNDIRSRAIRRGELENIPKSYMDEVLPNTWREGIREGGSGADVTGLLNGPTSSPSPRAAYTPPPPRRR